MSVHSFIYSNNPRYRFSRHVVFWLVWIAYLVFVASQKKNFSEYVVYYIIEMLIATSVDILLCYSVIYLLLPKYLIPGQYGAFFSLLGLFLLLDVALSSYFYTWIINPIRGAYNLLPLQYIAVTDLLRNLHSIMMMVTLATTIKLFKMWNVKKKELSLAKSEKIGRELKFVDTYIQPSFLPVMLKKIYSFSFSPGNRVPEMIDKLQNIMTYLIEECNQPAVLLSHEINSIKHFIQLEKLTSAGDLTIDYEQSGEPGHLRIVPFLLFPLVENNFRQINDKITDKHWANISIQIEGSRITMQLKNSKPVETSNLMNYETVNLQQMRKRLDLLYPGSYKMNIIIEENTFSIRLEIDLSKVVN
jgi:two-component system LytT family sensor kinase